MTTCFGILAGLSVIYITAALLFPGPWRSDPEDVDEWDL